MAIEYILALLLLKKPESIKNSIFLIFSTSITNQIFHDYLLFWLEEIEIIQILIERS